MCLGKWNKQTQSSLPFSPLEAESTCSGISSSISTGQGLSLTSIGPSTGPTSWAFTLQVYFTLLTWWVYTGSLHWLCILHATVFFQDAVDQATIYTSEANLHGHSPVGSVVTGLSLPYTAKYLCFPSPHPTPVIYNQNFDCPQWPNRVIDTYLTLEGLREKKSTIRNIFSPVFRDVLVNQLSRGKKRKKGLVSSFPTSMMLKILPLIISSYQ